MCRCMVSVHCTVKPSKFQLCVFHTLNYHPLIAYSNTSLADSLTHFLTHSLIHFLTHSFTSSLTHSLADSLTHPLTHSFTSSLTHSLVHFLIHFLTHSLTHSLPHSLTHPLTHPLTPSPTHPPTPSLTHSLVHFLIHFLTHSLTHSLPHSLTHPLTHHFIILVSSSCSNSVLSVKRLSMLDSICCRTSSDTTVFSWARLAKSMCCRKSLCNSDSPFTNLDWKRKSCDCSDGVWLIN